MKVSADTYQLLLRPILFKLDPERAHRLTLAALKFMKPLWQSNRLDLPALHVSLWGLNFSNPVGLAAGVDKDGEVAEVWERLGFGFAELGTVTLRPQPGNPKPRIWRLEEGRALINRMGFPSRGSDWVAERLKVARTRLRALRLAVSVGPNRDTPEDRIPEEFAQLLAIFQPYADFFVLNLSSPNTPGLRQWQSPAKLATLFERIYMALDRIFNGSRVSAPSEAGGGVTHQAIGWDQSSDGKLRTPLLIKLAPDIDSEVLNKLCAVLQRLPVDGIVAVNTTTAISPGLRVPKGAVGGLSGPPLKDKARETIRTLYRATEGRVPIIGVGGVESAEDAWGHIRAGASLIELYTSLVYQGPAVIGQITRGLAKLVKEHGMRSISEAVGTDA